MILEPVILLWLPLVFAIVAVFASQKWLASILLALTLFTAFFLGRIEISALLSIGLVFALSYSLASSTMKPFFRYVGWGGVFILCAMLSMHWLPGFNNLLVLDKVVAGAASTPFSMYLNLDKPLVFFALFLAYPKLLGDGNGRFKPAFITFCLSLSLLLVAAFLGALKFEFAIPDWWWLFALSNLFLTCVAEEALFRGFIQQSLSRRFNWQIGLTLASLLFGLAHVAGGVVLIIFAALAGGGYGLVFHFTQRLWCAVLAHFLFNFTHLVFFTYPSG